MDLPMSFEEKGLAVLMALVIGFVLWLTFWPRPAVAQQRRCYEVDLTIGNLLAVTGNQYAMSPTVYNAKVNGVVCEK